MFQEYMLGVIVKFCAIKKPTLLGRVGLKFLVFAF